jgi:hypothetical protein
MGMGFSSAIGSFVIGFSPIGGGETIPPYTLKPGLRTYGRVKDELGNVTWTEVTTDDNGFNDYVYVTALAQECQLNLNESPFWSDRGIPARPSIVQQIAPDYYMLLMQARYSPYFLNISIVRVPGATDPTGRPAPTYRVNITTHYGVTTELEVPT